MKKIITLIMLLASLATANAKCDWSKVYLAYGNTCNVYKFEVAGTVDTCYQVRTIITNKKTLKKDTFTSRAFGITFADTGKYNVFVKVYNKCLGCDTGFEKLIYVTCKPTTKPKCDWSKVKPGYSYSGRSYKFEISSIDTCLKYTNLRYGKGKVDTLNHDRVFGVTFSDTGVWYIISRVYNKCTGCDTSFYIRLHVTDPPSTTKGCDWSKIGLFSSNKCNTVVFELGSKDTCINRYSLWSYNHQTHKFDTLAHDRVFTRTLDTGWYTFKASFHNKCCNKDTFIYKEIHIGCDSSTLGLPGISRNFIRVSPNPASDRIMVCVTFPTKQPSVPYLIYNGNGTIVDLGFIASCVTLNTSSWRDGVYVIRIGNMTQRIVIQH